MNKFSNEGLHEQFALRIIVAKAFDAGRNAAEHYNSEHTMNDYRQAKVNACSDGEQAILQYFAGLIPEILEPIDVGALTGGAVGHGNTKDESKKVFTSSARLTEAQGAYLMAHNMCVGQLRDKLRAAGWKRNGA